MTCRALVGRHKLLGEEHRGQWLTLPSFAVRQKKECFIENHFSALAELHVARECPLADQFVVQATAEVHFPCCMWFGISAEVRGTGQDWRALAVLHVGRGYLLKYVAQATCIGGAARGSEVSTDVRGTGQGLEVLCVASLLMEL
ncbi:hypothetical protein NDU88_002848 [Pleurodeles waltl]|uniref:Uncharacterized protein n=1 Tax=Pleurodeles waltl TaxID=8319 RepID=A0AAV7UAU1_PLEWA|nr:hypothetical protein NDU88_002848 [Pleurodeles waltl]